MTHHTDMIGADTITAEALDDLEHVLAEQRVELAEEIAHSEQARNIFVNLIVATRREERRAIELLATMVGAEVATSVLAIALLRRVKRDAVSAPRAGVLPAGVATPVPATDVGDVTPLHSPRPMIEVTAPHDSAPTIPLKPNFTQGPWPLPAAKPGKPLRRR